MAGIATTDVIIYADPVNGSDATGNGLKPGSAVKSLTKALALAGQYASHLGRMEIVLAPGTFAALPAGTRIVPSAPSGSGTPFVIRGLNPALDGGATSAWSTTAGPFTVTSKLNADIGGVNITAGSITANQLRGSRVKMLTGASAGRENRVRKHTASPTPAITWITEDSLVAANDTFSVQAPAAIVPINDLTIVGEHVAILDGIKFTDAVAGASITFNGKELTIAGVDIVGSLGTMGLTAAGGKIQTDFPPTLATPAYPTDGTAAGRGCYFVNVICAAQAPGSLFVYSTVHDGGGGAAWFQCAAGGYMRIVSSYTCNGGNFNWYGGDGDIQGHHATNVEADGTVFDGTFVYGAFNLVGPCRVASVTYATVSNPGAGLDAMHVRNGGMANLTGDNGGALSAATPGTGGFALQAAAGAKVQFVAGLSSGGAAGSQTAVEGVSHDWSAYAGATNKAFANVNTTAVIQQVASAAY